MMNSPACFEQAVQWCR